MFIILKMFSYALPWLATIGGVSAAISKGHDLSSVAQMENSEGATWLTTSGQQTSIEGILGSGGMDSVRLRYAVFSERHNFQLIDIFTDSGLRRNTVSSILSV